MFFTSIEDLEKMIDKMDNSAGGIKTNYQEILVASIDHFNILMGEVDQEARAMLVFDMNVIEFIGKDVGLV